MPSPLESQAESLILGGKGGPVVVVNARVADYLTRHAGLGEFRRRHRGRDLEIDGALLALAVAGSSWSGTEAGTASTNSPEPRTGSTLVGTAEAAARLGITSRAVTKAITEGRLKATKNGSTWRIHRADLDHFRAQRPH